MRDAQPPRLTTLSLEGFRESLQGGAVTGQDHLRRPVHRRHTHRAFQQRRYVLLSGLHREHGATLRQRLHQPAPGRHQPHRILKRPQPRHISRHQLTNRVPTKHLRPQPERLRKPKQRHLDREQRRLRVPGLLQRLSLRAEQHLGQRPLQQRIEVRTHLIQRIREHREGVVQLPPHPRPLTALTGEQHPEPTLDHRPGHHPRTAGSQRLQALEEVVAAPAEDHRPMFQCRPTGQQRPAHIHRRAAGVGHQMLPQPLGLSPQGDRTARRHHPRHRARRSGRRSRLLRGRRLLDDDMRVRPAHTERRHTRPTRHVRPLRPLPSLRQQFNRTSRPVHMRTGCVHMQRPRQHTVPHREDHLDHTGDTRGRLGVPDVRLDRPQPQRPILRTLLPVRGQERLRLDRVTQRRTGPVRLHHVHITGRQTRVRQRSPDHPLLRRPIGSRQTIARPVLIDGRTPHHRKDLMSVAPGIREPLQEQQTDTLTPPGAVRSLRERLATAVRRQPPLTTELQEGRRCDHDGHATGEGHVALALPQRLRRQVQGDQRGRARRVHRHRRPLQPERVRQATGDDARRVAGHEVPLDTLRLMSEPGRPTLRTGADEDPGPAALQRRRCDARPFEQLPGGLQQQPLLRVHRQRLTRRDTEEARVEICHVVEESALCGEGALRGVVLRGGEQRLRVPASVRGEDGDRVRAFGQQLPELFRAGGTAGVAAAHRHDGDRVVVHAPHDHRHGTAGRRRVPLPHQFGTQIPRQRGRGRIVEDQRRRQLQARRRGQTVADLHRRQRVEAQLPESTPRIHSFRSVVAEHGRRMSTHQVQQHRLTLGPGHPQQPAPQLRQRTVVLPHALPGRQGLANFGEFPEERAGPHRRERRSEPLPVHIRHRQEHLTARHRLLQRQHGQLRRHRPHTPAPQMFLGRRSRCHAALAPRAPGH
ncbi:hypothetical protein SALBM311S_04719 [Streptomyces alboniger]